MGEIVAAGATVHAPQSLPILRARMCATGRRASRRCGNSAGRCWMRARPDVLDRDRQRSSGNLLPLAVPTFALIAGERIRRLSRAQDLRLPCHPMAEGCWSTRWARASIWFTPRTPSWGHAFAAPFEWVLEKREIPIVPVFVNSYLPPLPTARRCAALGKAIAEYIGEAPERSGDDRIGGMSHYPGTWKYPQPGYDFDCWAIAHLEQGNTEAILNLTTRNSMKSAIRRCSPGRCCSLSATAAADSAPPASCSAAAGSCST